MTDTLPPLSASRVSVVCLCAAWCGVCRDFEPALTEWAQRHPNVAFLPLDVEDQAEWLDDLDVENFPTVLLGVNGTPVFFGTVLPQVATLERLVQQAPGMPPLRGHEHQATLLALLKRFQAADGV